MERPILLVLLAVVVSEVRKSVLVSSLMTTGNLWGLLKKLQKSIFLLHSRLYPEPLRPTECKHGTRAGFVSASEFSVQAE